LTIEKLLPGDDGCIHPPEAPGLGVEPDSQAIRKYAVNVEITVAGQRVYTTPSMV
jgi:L-alanine-DL-glutamate epimerase-like enolase superfamily enzyme